MDQKDEIKQKLNISEIIAEYIQLKPAGGGSFKAACPFHSEKTPSFHVSTEKQIWHCFGCDKGGDVISFVMEIEGVDFISALKLLGEKAGVEITQMRPEINKDEKELAYQLYDLATKFYRKILVSHELGVKARDYIQKRNIPADISDLFRLGAAPDSWNSLLIFLESRGYNCQQIEKSGLIKKKKSGAGYIDRFRNRLIIPLSDSSGRVIGFTGRLLGEQTEETGPKYLNSPETIIYHKGDVLFGLHLAKRTIREKGNVIVVEGNIDVISSHKAGVLNVVASSGTALTESQLTQLKKLTKTILFCFDDDAAGFAAAIRGIRLALSIDLSALVVAIPHELGKDPDDVVCHNPQAWVELVQKPIQVMQYVFNKMIAKTVFSDIESKKIFINILINELSYFRNPIEREHWLLQISDVSRTDIALLRRLLLDANKNQKNNFVIKYNDKLLSNQRKLSKKSIIAQTIIGYLFISDDFLEKALMKLDEKFFPRDWTAVVYKKIHNLYTQGKLSVTTPIQKNKTYLFTLLHNELGQEAISAILKAEELTVSINKETARAELHRHINLLVCEHALEKRSELESNIRQAEMSGDSNQVGKLLEEYSKLL